jgi:seryl-tRNA synthetase
VLRRWYPTGEQPVGRENILSHHEVLYRIGGYEQEPRGVKVVGHRGYFLTDYGVRMNLALVQYGLDFLSKRNYIPIQTPFFMNKDVMAKTAQLDDFDEQLYKVIYNQYH